jgi:hypothetical protein
VVDHLPYPEQLYLEVCGLIFPNKGDSATTELSPLPRGSCGRMIISTRPHEPVWTFFRPYGAA